MRAFCLALLLPALALAQEPPPALSLPLACAPGRDCWIANHVDLDPGPGARDYACGRFTYDGHNGVDLALRDLRAMAEGVAVLAAAPGRVLRTRGREPDQNVRERGVHAVKGRECGNGVVLEHAGGLQTQYCHLRAGSVRVKPGDTVAAGEALGLVGLSGKTEYPHLHFTVRREGRVLDPFRGLDESEGCGPGTAPLWSREALTLLPYAPRAIYNYGVAAVPVSAEAVRRGEHGARALAADAPVFAVWVEAFGVTAGDVVEIRAETPEGAPLLGHRSTLAKPQARIFRSVAKKRGAEPWPAGQYPVRITITPGEGGAQGASSVEFAAEVRP